MKKNKLKEFLRGIVTINLTAAMCLGTLIPAFAAPDTSPDSPAAVITKKLEMPEGTAMPDATFSFKFEKVSVDDSSDAADLEIMPTIGSIPSGETDAVISITVDPAVDTGQTDDTSGVKSVIKESGNILDNVTFPHAGVYVYNVKEVQPATPNANYTFSQAEYLIRFYVNNENNDLYVNHVTAEIVVPDNGDKGSIGTKVSTAPGAEDSKLIFTNTYTKTKEGEDPTSPENHTLAISKKVIGHTSGDYADRTKYFPFVVTVTKPSLVTDQVTYKAYVVESADNNGDVTYTVETSTKNYAGLSEDDTDTYGKYIQFTPGEPLTVNLRHGQTLAFTGGLNGLHIGAKYVATELAVEHYKAKAELLVDGAAIVFGNDTANKELSTSDRLIGENANSAAFTNEYREITPTGVVINNLPFIMILLLAAGALAGFVVVKSKKKNRYIY